MDEKERILIVDDDESTRKSLSLIFDKRKYETATVETGREALQKAQEGFFNLAVLDIKLPDMEGVELIAPLKERHPDMVVIMATAYASIETAVRALNDGASAYIVKPLNMDEVLVTIREALEKQRLIREKRQAEKALRESEGKLRVLFDSIADGIAVSDMKGRITEVNEAQLHIVGYSREEVIGKDGLEFVAEKDRDRAVEDLTKVFDEERGVVAEYTLLAKGGREFDAEANAALLRDGAGRPVGFISAVRDITDRKTAEGELARVKKEKDAQIIQSAKLASLGEMATGIAHEINQPLSVIKLTSSGLQRLMRRGKTIDSETLMEELQSIDSQIERVRAIINHMRSFARRPAETKSEHIDINVPLQDCFRFVGEQLRLGEIEVQMDLQELPLVMADSNKIEQVFMNIIGNARDAMDEFAERVGGNHQKVLKVRSFVEEGKAVVAFTDTGGGIPEYVRDRILEPFFTTKEVGRGTGLGLSVSYSIIRDYGGTLDFWVDEGVGTTFRVALPASAEAEK